MVESLRSQILNKVSNFTKFTCLNIFPAIDPAKKMAISGSGKYLAYTGKDSTLKVFDLTTKEEIEIQAKTEPNIRKHGITFFQIT